MPTSAAQTYSGAHLQPYMDPTFGPVMTDVQLGANLTIVAGQVLAELVGTVDVQNLHASAAISAGTYTVFDGTNTSAVINWNDTAAQMNTKLLAATPGPIKFIATGGTFSTPTDYVLTRTAPGVQAALTLTNQVGVTGGTLSVVHTTTGAAGTPGTFTAYDASGSGGAEVAKVLAVYAMTTDASGNITLIGEYNQTYKAAPVYVAGTFATADIPNLTAAIISQLGGHLTSGTVISGVVRFG